MKQVVLDGISYTKAAEVAKKFGYTSDYVGQLCRSGKVDAQLIGRSWYVSEDSIQSHKKQRYQKSPKTPTVRAIKPKQVLVNKNRQNEKTINNKIDIATDEKTYQLSVRKSLPKKPVLPITRNKLDKNFEERIQWKANTVYEQDEKDLMPELKKPKIEEKPTKIPVNPADAKKVLVEGSGQPEAKLQPTKMPTISLNGTLKIESYDVELAENMLENKPEITHSQNPKQLKNTKGVIALRREKKLDKPSFTPKSVLQKNTGNPLMEPVLEGDLDVYDEMGLNSNELAIEEEVPRSRWVTYATLIIWFLIFLTPVLILGIELVVTGTQNSLSESFLFNLSALKNFSLF